MTCIFCVPGDPVLNTILSMNDTCFLRKDNFPVTPGHMEVVTRRHVVSIFDLTDQEWLDVFELLQHARGIVPSIAFTIGVNEGKTAGRTIDHFHLHIFPRKDGDSPNPMGGVRNVIHNVNAGRWLTS